ncbi:hypothetical protein CYMTET_16930 [Cymbomonas tetramitiformis]|uniref:MYND-type domain-containing protein n=1 Tax=Cymbomonas tetramitiformis TaxID=36881 RepID=A0AAE0GAY9_9CHLO|nr:hypothetical protein CYMTET_16930 [Cymbomonas tetramitiformis]|eukprot:gene4220-5198_t
MVKNTHQPFVNDASASMSSHLTKGDYVQLRGLQSSPEMNGMYGTLFTWNPDKQRWVVRLEKPQAGYQKLSIMTSVRPQNIEWISRLSDHDPTVAAAQHYDEQQPETDDGFRTRAVTTLETSGMLDMGCFLTLEKGWGFQQSLQHVSPRRVDIQFYNTTNPVEHHFQGADIIYLLGISGKQSSSSSSAEATSPAMKPTHLLLGKTHLTVKDIKGFQHQFSTTDRPQFPWPDHRAILMCPVCHSSHRAGTAELILSINPLIQACSVTKRIGCRMLPRLFCSGCLVSSMQSSADADSVLEFLDRNERGDNRSGKQQDGVATKCTPSAYKLLQSREHSGLCSALEADFFDSLNRSMSSGEIRPPPKAQSSAVTREEYDSTQAAEIAELLRQFGVATDDVMPGSLSEARQYDGQAESGYDEHIRDTFGAIKESCTISNDANWTHMVDEMRDLILRAFEHRAPGDDAELYNSASENMTDDGTNSDNDADDDNIIWIYNGLNTCFSALHDQQSVRQSILREVAEGTILSTVTTFMLKATADLSRPAEEHPHAGSASLAKLWQGLVRDLFWVTYTLRQFVDVPNLAKLLTRRGKLSSWTPAELLQSLTYISKCCNEHTPDPAHLLENSLVIIYNVLVTGSWRSVYMAVPAAGLVEVLKQDLVTDRPVPSFPGRTEAHVLRCIGLLLHTAFKRSQEDASDIAAQSIMQELSTANIFTNAMAALQRNNTWKGVSASYAFEFMMMHQAQVPLMLFEWKSLQEQDRRCTVQAIVRTLQSLHKRKFDPNKEFTMQGNDVVPKLKREIKSVLSLLKSLLQGRPSPWNEGLATLFCLEADPQTSDKAVMKSAEVRRCKCCRKQEGREAARLSACQLCKTALYCSKECQKKDWKQGKHKDTCVGRNK